MTLLAIQSRIERILRCLGENVSDARVEELLYRRKRVTATDDHVDGCVEDLRDTSAGHGM
jgi:hypothetical protein